jgi:hypothetical protein
VTEVLIFLSLRQRFCAMRARAQEAAASSKYCV